VPSSLSVSGNTGPMGVVVSPGTGTVGTIGADGGTGNGIGSVVACATSAPARETIAATTATMTPTSARVVVRCRRARSAMACRRLPQRLDEPDGGTIGRSVADVVERRPNRLELVPVLGGHLGERRRRALFGGRDEHDAVAEPQCDGGGRPVEADPSHDLDAGGGASPRRSAGCPAAGRPTAGRPATDRPATLGDHVRERDEREYDGE
jgi:hypothetical protein